MPPAHPREALLELAAIERGSAGPGEERAAQLLESMLREYGLEPALEREPAVGGYWQSSGLAATAGALAGLLAGRPRRRGARAAGLAVPVASAAASADEIDCGLLLRRGPLP